MSRPPIADQRLDAWLESGPSTGPDDGLSEALARAHSTRQRPGWLVLLRGGTMETTWRARPVLTARLTFAMVLTLLAVALVGTALIVGSRLTSQNTVSPAIPLGGGAVLAYAAPTDGQSDIYTVRADGTDRRRITVDPADEVSPVFSPDGSAIAFYRVGPEPDRSRSLYVVDAAGPRMLAEGLGCLDDLYTQPGWSPDGRFIIVPRNFVGCNDETESLWVVAVDGSSGLRRLNGPAVDGNDTQAAWSPTGDRVAFMQFKDGTTSLWVGEVADPHAPWDLEAHQVRAMDPFVFGSWQAPSWSPDGTMIASLVGTNETAADSVVVSSDGTRLWNQFDTARRVLDEGQPAWSPDGSVLSTTLLTGTATGNQARYDLYLATPDGSEARLVETPGLSGWDRAPFSPDGSRVAGKEPSASADGPPGGLLVITLDGSAEPVRIATEGWSPISWQPLDAPLPPDVDPGAA